MRELVDELRAYVTWAGDAGLKNLKHLKELEYVNLGCNHATEAGLTEFKKVMPKVKVASSPAETEIK